MKRSGMRESPRFALSGLRLLIEILYPLTKVRERQPINSGGKRPAFEGAGFMFGLFDGIKYRSAVVVQIHTILILVPQLKSVLNTFPTLNHTISSLRKENISELEAAARLSLLVVERLMEPASPDSRLLILQYLNKGVNDGFQQSLRFYKAVKEENREPEHPAGMPVLAPVLGFACWYLHRAVLENNLSEQCFQIFVGDIIGMLQGTSQNERRKNRVMNALF
jgi:hypothetical protein